MRSSKASCTDLTPINTNFTSNNTLHTQNAAVKAAFCVNRTLCLVENVKLNSPLNVRLFGATLSTTSARSKTEKKNSSPMCGGTFCTPTWGRSKSPTENTFGGDPKKENFVLITRESSRVLCLFCSVPNMGETLSVLLFEKNISLPSRLTSSGSR